MTMRNLTLSLSSQEIEILETLARKKGLTKTSVIRQAIRVYQTLDRRIERGDKIFFEDEKKDKAELVLL